MPVPRNRVSNAHKNNRRSHSAKKVQSLSTCPNCDAKYKSHHVCVSCGHYDKREVVKVVEVEEVE